MASIEKVEETVVREMFVMRYDRAELEERAANPLLFVREIKAVLDGGKHQPLKRAIAPAVKPTKKVQKKKPQKVAAVVETTEGAFRCPLCKRTFKTQGWLNQHEAKVHDLGNIEIGTYQPERDEPAE